MTTPTCNHCGRSDPEPQALLHPPTGKELELCGPCLRAMARAKAARSDEHGRERLVAAAEEDAHEVWRTDHVLYLLPPLTEAEQRSQTQDEPPTVGKR